MPPHVSNSVLVVELSSIPLGARVLHTSELVAFVEVTPEDLCVFALTYPERSFGNAMTPKAFADIENKAALRQCRHHGTTLGEAVWYEYILYRAP